MSEEERKALPNLLDEKAKVQKQIPEIEEKKRLADLEAENKALKEELAKFESPVKGLQAEVKALGEEKKALEKRVADMEAEKHLGLVKKVVELKVKIGLIEASNTQSETERLKKLDDQSLAVTREALQKIREELQIHIKKLDTTKNHRLYR